MKKIKYILWLITSPKYWVMNYKYDKEVDEVISSLLDNYEFERVNDSPYFFSLGGHWLWCANRPYACFKIYCGSETYRPSRKTIERGVKKLESKYDLKKLEKERSDYLEKLEQSIKMLTLKRYQ